MDIQAQLFTGNIHGAARSGSIGPRPAPSGTGAERLASTWNGSSPIHVNRSYIIDKPYGFRIFDLTGPICTKWKEREST